MRFYFPDSQDQVDPRFDMVTEEHPIHRIRQRDDAYAHEILKRRPFDGILVSKPIVDGYGNGAAGKYSAASRSRLYREGVQEFFRINRSEVKVTALGDCGAFAYAMEEEPPYSVDEVIDFYDGCGFDAGVAPDHIVFGFVREPGLVPHDMEPEWERRRALTIHNAELFLRRHGQRYCTFTPLAVAHGWCPATYADSVDQLQNLGYQRIALGGMVPLKTPDILLALEAIAEVLKPETELHLLGVTRTEEIPTFAGLGVTSFDSTSPVRQSFKDDRDNYFSLDTTYVALRVPQVDGNPALKRAITAGKINQRDALAGERACLEALRGYDQGVVDLDDALQALLSYEHLTTGSSVYDDSYRRTLEDAPWKLCDCGICENAGIDVMMFRGSERNKRRGFHNLAVFRARLDRTLKSAAEEGIS